MNINSNGKSRAEMVALLIVGKPKPLERMKKLQIRSLSYIALAVSLLGLNLTPALANLIVTGTTGTAVFPYGNGGETIPLTVPGSLNFNGVSGSLDFILSVPTGYQINVNPISGTFFGFEVAYDGTGAGLANAGASTYSFIGLQGTAPTLQNFTGVVNGAVGWYIAGYIDPSPFAFTGIQFSIPVSGTGNNVSYGNGNATLNIQHGGTLSVTPVPDAASTALLFSASLGFVLCGRQLTKRKTV